MNRSLAIAGAMVIIVQGGLHGASVQMELGTTKSRYDLGDEVTFVLTFRNASDKTLRLFPDPEQYDIRTISLVNLTNHRQPQPLQFAELSTYYGSWARDMVILKPKETFTWKIRAQFRDRLPPDWNDPSAGTYLIFYGGTAFKLPGFGKYSVVARYNFHREHPVLKYTTAAGPEIWFGELKLGPVLVDFNSKK